MLISVIIPSYNRADTVGQTIESIVAQKVDAEVEIVIGDDCSTDNAREVLEAYRKKYPDIIRLFLWEQNMGLGANWARCVKECRGRYICNCDNDDYWHNPSKLQLQKDYMESHPGCNICITNHRKHNRTTGEIVEEEAFIPRDVPLQDAIYGDGRTGFCNATIMYRADFLKEHVSLDEFISRRLSLQDWPVWVILAAYTDIDILPVSTATFGVETVSITRPDSIERFKARLLRDKEVSRYIGELFPEKFSFTEEDWEPFANGQLVKLAFRLGDYENARLYGRHCTGVGRVKRFASQNKVLFDCFILLRRMKNCRNSH